MIVRYVSLSSPLHVTRAGLQRYVALPWKWQIGKLAFRHPGKGRMLPRISLAKVRLA
jgi:hypothetical protein